MDMSQYKEMFVSEASEYLQNLNNALLSLERAPEDVELLQEIFRSAHTLKGMSASMGYRNMETLTHRMENLLDRLRNNELQAGPDILNVLFECLDMLESMTESIESDNNDTADISSISKKIDGFGVFEKPGKPLDEPVLEEAPVTSTRVICMPEQGSSEYDIHISLEKTCEFRGIRAFLVIQNISEIGNIISTTPQLQDIEDENFGLEFSIIVQTDRKPDEIEKKAKSVAEISTVKVSAIKVEKKDEAQKAAVKDNGIKGIHSVRIDIDRLDIIMNLVGELVISRGRLFQIGGKHGLSDLNETLTMVDRSITDLQNEIMRIRMLPVDHVFNRFPRIVRDISKKEGKDIDLIIEGQDTELDRTVLDEISDPLNHLIRNAVDHGIEKPEEREVKGKPGKGTVKLIARRERSNVIIQVEDDGKGIDINRVKQKSIDRGIITEAQAAAMSDDEAVMLIFKPGLSTAEKLTEVSGRGVGMDIVKTKVESLGGTVKVETKIGEGTKTILKLPPTIAIVQALIIKVGEERYAISITNVVESEYVTSSDIKTIGGKEVIMIRDGILPLIRLNNLFNIPSENIGQKRTVIVVEKGYEKVGLLADLIESQQEIFVKPLSGLLQNMRGFEGVTIMGDGQVVPILDIATLVEVKT